MSKHLLLFLGLASLTAVAQADPSQGLDKSGSAVEKGVFSSEEALREADQRTPEEADRGMDRARDASGKERWRSQEGINRGRDAFDRPPFRPANSMGAGSMDERGGPGAGGKGKK